MSTGRRFRLFRHLPRPPSSPSSGRRGRSARRYSSPVRTSAPTDFLSPIAISEVPIGLERVPASSIAHILTWGDDLCRQRIGMPYLRDKLRDRTVGLWTIKDADEDVFGFAITSDAKYEVTLHLICSLKRKGEGTRLFDRIVEHCKLVRKDLILEPIDRKVAELYRERAQAAGCAVYRARRGTLVEDSIPRDWEFGRRLEMMRIQTP